MNLGLLQLSGQAFELDSDGGLFLGRNLAQARDDGAPLLKGKHLTDPGSRGPF